MNEEVLSSIILQIMDNGSMDGKDDVSGRVDFEDSEEVIEIINSILLTHANRYQLRFESDRMQSETGKLVDDYRIIFNKKQPMSEDMLIALFKYITCDSYLSVEFTETCVAIEREIRSCAFKQIQYLLAKRLTHQIISFRLYTREPFTGILRSMSCLLSEIKESNGTIETILFLE